MASGGLSRTLKREHEAYYDFPCTLCAEDGISVEATKRCNKCAVYMCHPCVKKHDRLMLPMRHTMVDQTQFTTAGLVAVVSFPTEHCARHPGEMLCRIHNVVCCSVCERFDHSSCDGMEYLTDAAKGIQKNREYNCVMKETKAFIADVDKVLSNRKADKSRIVKEKHQVKQSIEDFRKQMNKYFDDLETNSLNELDMKEKLLVDGIDKDVRDLDSMRTEAGDVLKKLESFKGDNECELFVHVKPGKLMMNDAKEKCAGVSRTVNRESIVFKIDPKIEEFVKSLNMLGTFSLSPQTAPGPPGLFNMKETSDGKTCNIIDICQLLDGTTLVIDCNNMKLKRLDQSYTLLDSVQMSGDPGGVCAIGPDEVAVALRQDKKIQVVSVGRKLTLTRSFTVGNTYGGIAYMGGILYVCCGDDESSDRIELYNNAGILQYYIPRSQPLSFMPYCITASDDGQHLFVTNYDSSDITMLGLAGHVINTFSDKDLDSPLGICTDDRGHVFVCGLHSNTVLQLSPGQQKIEVILRETDGIKRPLAVCYDRKTSRLVVTCNQSNNLYVFKIK